MVELLRQLLEHFALSHRALLRCSCIRRCMWFQNESKACKLRLAPILLELWVLTFCQQGCYHLCRWQGCSLCCSSRIVHRCRTALDFLLGRSLDFFHHLLRHHPKTAEWSHLDKQYTACSKQTLASTRACTIFSLLGMPKCSYFRHRGKRWHPSRANSPCSLCRRSWYRLSSLGLDSWSSWLIFKLWSLNSGFL